MRWCGAIIPGGAVGEVPWWSESVLPGVEASCCRRSEELTAAHGGRRAHQAETAAPRTATVPPDTDTHACARLEGL